MSENGNQSTLRPISTKGERPTIASHKTPEHLIHKRTRSHNEPPPKEHPKKLQTGTTPVAGSNQAGKTHRTILAPLIGFLVKRTKTFLWYPTITKGDRTRARIQERRGKHGTILARLLTEFLLKL